MIGQQALLFRIELQNILPSIWREVLVPSNCSFWDLHVAIQDSMGWLDNHLHAFHVQDPHSAALIEIGIPDEEIAPGSNSVLAAWEVPLRSYLNAAAKLWIMSMILETVGNIESFLKRSHLRSQIPSIRFAWVVNARVRRKIAEECGDIKPC